MRSCSESSSDSEANEFIDALEEEIERSESTSDDEGDVVVKVQEVEKEQPKIKPPLVIRSIPNEPPPQYGQFPVHNVVPEEEIQPEYDDAPPSYNPFSKNILTESQFQTVTNSLEVTKELQSRSQLTNTQHQRLKVALGNIRQVQRKLIQIIQNYANNPEVCSNLINILDQINVALDNDSDDEEKNEEKEEIIQDYQNILALSQFVISDPDDPNQVLADEEFARRLQEELNREDNSNNNLVIEDDIIPVAPPLPQHTLEDLAKFKAEEKLQELEKSDPAAKDKYFINPLNTLPGDGEKIILKSVFFPIPFTFYTPKNSTLKIVQYVEFEIAEITPYFKFPFSIILSQDGESSSLESMINLPINQLLEQLRPWGASISQKHSLSQSVKVKYLFSKPYPFTLPIIK